MTCEISPFSSYSMLHILSVISYRDYDDEFKNKNGKYKRVGSI
jgi:hypothetical protein